MKDILSDLTTAKYKIKNDVNNNNVSEKNNVGGDILSDLSSSKYKLKSSVEETPTTNTFTVEDAIRRMNTKQEKDAKNSIIQQAVQSQMAKEKAEKAKEQERWDNLSIGQKIVDPIKTMGANIKYGDLGIKENQAWSEYRSKQDAETLAKAQEATKAREAYEVSNNRIGKGNALTKDFAQYIPQLGGQLTSGLGNAAGGAAAGAGTALAIGQLGPQVGLPEELITVPAGALWGGRAGYVAGTAKYSYDVMAGNAYKNLLDMGVPNEVAIELSGDEALINSLIEGTGAVVDLVSLGLGKLASKSSLTAAQKIAQNKLMQAGTAYGMNLISEPLEEMAQEKVSIETEKKAADMSGIERQATDAEDAERIKQSGIGALKVSAISGLGNAGGNIITNKVSDKITQNKINNQIKQEEIQKNIQDYKQNSPYSKYIAQNQLKGLENLIPQKNVASESVTSELKQPAQQTNRIEDEMAQTGNMTQMAKNIENSNILEYNNDRGVENGEKTNSERYTSEVRDGLYQEGSEENRQYNKSEYEQWEQSLKPISRERLTTEEITDIDNTQKEYGKTVNLIDENENPNKYSGGASLIKKGQLNISRQQAEYFGLKNMIEHEVVEDDILHDDVANDILTPAIELIMNDAKFDDQKKAFWEGQTDNMPTDVLIAKDILCDRFAEIKNNTKMKYNNVLSAEVNTNIDMALQNYYKQVYGKNLNTQADTQSAFSMPETDNHGRELTKEEQEILKESKIRDSDGKLIEVYHRTNQDFDEFDKSKFGSATDDGIWGQGFYFSNRDHVDYGKNLKKGYLNITNPFVVDDFKTIEQMADYLDMSERNFHYEPDGLVRVSYNQIRQFTAHVQEKGHDGVIANHGEGLYEYVAFEPEQIVLESNNISSTPKNYINPAQDIQKASDFINKATVEDIDALNKMVEEAEKYPDRIDLQYFAEKARETIEKLSRQQVRQTIMEETGVGSYNLDDVNKISKVKMNFTTPVRVIEKVFNKETANKINENFFKPIKHNEAERIRRLNKERNDIKELDIKPGTAEDAAIQKYGEGEYVDENGLTIPYTLENLKRDFPDTWQKLQNATNVIRSKYDTYLEEINEVLQDNGYDPIPKRKDYFRHFEELNDLFSVLGVPTKVDDIPTDLNGMTADLKPGKQFFANALQRKGKKTTYSAVKGIDGYLDGAMNILYHTKDIQRLRTLDKYIRDTYGQAKGLADANTMTEEQKAKRINQINEGHLSEFAAWLTEYTNALAGKKSRLDRGVEEMFGRKSYKYLNLMKKQVGANMTGLNLNSALSNFISVIQAGPKTSKKALLKGTAQTIKNIFTKDGFVDKSDFLTTRFGSDKLAKNWWQKAGDAGQIFMSGTDYFTANLIVRSKYQEYIDKGYTQEQAIKKADEFADRLMAGRGKGDLPTAFESKMLGIVTQFQLEVTNQLDSIFYDTLHEDYAAESTSKLAKEHPKFYNAASATFILGQLFALAFLYNEGKEELTGTEGGALDPIGTIVDAIKYLTDENLSKPEAMAKIVEDIANQLPFLSIFTSGGRIPIKEAFPDLLSVAKGEAKLGDEMWNLTNLLLPTGGGQLKKTTQGLNTFAKGGSYTKDAEGKDKLKYPVEQNFENLVKSMVFGKWATEGAKDYIDRGFKSLSAKQTEGYEKAMKAGITSEEFYKAYDAQRGIKGLGDLTSPYKKTKIDEATKGLNKQQRTILYDVFDVSKTAQQSSKKVTDEQAKKQKEKLEKEKQKELKGFNVKFNK